MALASAAALVAAQCVWRMGLVALVIELLFSVLWVAFRGSEPARRVLWWASAAPAS